MTDQITTDRWQVANNRDTFAFQVLLRTQPTVGEVSLECQHEQIELSHLNMSICGDPSAPPHSTTSLLAFAK